VGRVKQQERDRKAAAALAESRERGFGPHILPADRVAEVLRLRAHCCTWDEIGRHFGLVRETVMRQAHAELGRLASLTLTDTTIFR
jgi:hypothetical protein